MDADTLDLFLDSSVARDALYEALDAIWEQMERENPEQTIAGMKGLRPR